MPVWKPLHNEDACQSQEEWAQSLEKTQQVISKRLKDIRRTEWRLFVCQQFCNGFLHRIVTSGENVHYHIQSQHNDTGETFKGT